MARRIGPSTSAGTPRRPSWCSRCTTTDSPSRPRSCRTSSIRSGAARSTASATAWGSVSTSCGRSWPRTAGASRCARTARPAPRSWSTSRSPPRPRPPTTWPVEGSSSFVADQDHRGIVDSAVGVGGVEQLPGGGWKIGRAQQDRLHDVVVDHSRQAVAAEHQEIAGAQLVLVQFHVHLPLLAERAEDDVLLRKGPCLLVGDLSLPQVFLDQRVVDGDAAQLAFAQVVDAAVPRV